LVAGSAPAAEGDIPIEQVGGSITTQTLSGDATITAAGVLSLATGAVGDNEIDYTNVTLNDFTNDAGYFDALADFTGTLTDAYLCTYNLAGGQLVCNTAPATFEPAGVTATDITDSTTAGRTLLTAADAAAQRTVLNVEDGADVTDTANVTAAGALMDSEVDADIKTLTIGASASVSGSNTGDQDLSSYRQGPDVIWFAVSDEDSDLVAGAAALTLEMPRAFTIDTSADSGAGCSVTTAPTGTQLIVDIHEAGATIMTTNKIDIDVGETNSQDAATAPGVTDTALAKGSVITIDIDQVGSTVAGAGLKCWLIGEWQ
jgi:hypothetical protein